VHWSNLAQNRIYPWPFVNTALHFVFPQNAAISLLAEQLLTYPWNSYITLIPMKMAVFWVVAPCRLV
jgi:hypothetical protein